VARVVQSMRLPLCGCRQAAWQRVVADRSLPATVRSTVMSLILALLGVTDAGGQA
jgi:hypothetical protein